MKFNLGDYDLGDLGLGDFSLGDLGLGDFNLGDFDLIPVIHIVIIFRPYFIWERKIFKSNGFFLQNLPRIIVYVI